MSSCGDERRDARHDQRVTYAERATSVEGVTLWRWSAGSAPEPGLILPDGCLDLLWDGARLFVAGPDTTARWHEGKPDASLLALRFSSGTGPEFLGIPADELRDRTVSLDDLWPAGDSRRLADQIASDPAELGRWLVQRAASRPVDPIGVPVFAMASAGVPVAVMADRLGISPRQLHRRCLPVFGYGPLRLARVLRMGRALDHARAGMPLAQVAAVCRYADQAHLSREVRALVSTTPTTLLAELGAR